MTSHLAQIIAAVCDTLVPSIDIRGDTAEAALLRTSAADLGIPTLICEMRGSWMPHVRELVDHALSELGKDFAAAPYSQRAAQWRDLQCGRSTRPGAYILQNAVLAMFYTLADEEHPNPTWPALGYPGPLTAPPSARLFPKSLTTVNLPDDEFTVMRTRVVVVGSGAAGGVAAAIFAEAGLKVLVIERGEYRNEPELLQLEAAGLPRLYLGGGFIWTSDATAGLLAGATVGGGTAVNSMACIPTPSHVLAEWAARGVEGVDPVEFAGHVAAVMQRINATKWNTVHSPVNRVLNRGLDALGLPREQIARNARDADERFCSGCGSGCPTGCKQSTMKTYLQDASDHGAELLVNAIVERVLHRDGRATGVECTVRTDAGLRPVTVEADAVVLAAGALGSPVVLLESGIGGPAVGYNLHLHPSFFMSGVFDDEVAGWPGHILTSACRAFEQVEKDHGFIVEAGPMSVGAWTGQTPWQDGEDHKRRQLRLPRVSGVWGFIRDHGAGRVTSEGGMPRVEWCLDDEIDLAVVRRCHVELARILHAAGAREIFTFLHSDLQWRAGEDFDAFLAALATVEPHDVFTTSAHQSGTAAAGVDPAESVVDGRGQLHDVRGVYVLDASALPTSPGVNPMISIMAFARNVAQRVVADLNLDPG